MPVSVRLIKKRPDSREGYRFAQHIYIWALVFLRIEIIRANQIYPAIRNLRLNNVKMFPPQTVGKVIIKKDNVRSFGVNQFQTPPEC